MRLVYLLLLVGCGDTSNRHIADARALDARVDAPADAPPDAKPCPPPLVGGTDVLAQGWTVTQQAPATLSYGADYVELATTTNNAANTGGQLLLVHAGAVTPGQPFTLRAEIQITTVTPHNQFDSGTAILGSMSGGAGSQIDRAEMIYIDRDKIGWADDSASAAHNLDTTAFHTYELTVDAAGTATVSLDGAALLARPNYTTTGTIAIGDQSNDPNVDGTMRIRSVTQVCN